MCVNKIKIKSNRNLMLSQVQESRGGYTCIRLHYLPFESVGKANELELLNIHIYSIAQSNPKMN